MEPGPPSSKFFYVLNSVQYSMFIYLFNTKIKNVKPLPPLDSKVKANFDLIKYSTKLG